MKQEDPFRLAGVIAYRSYAELVGETQRSLAGFAWWVLDPVISIAIYYFVFSTFLARGEEHFPQFLCIGIVMWRWMQNTVTRGSGSIIAGRGLMQQVQLPKVVFPASSALTDSFKFLFVLVLLLLFLWLSGFRVGLAYLALPLLLLCQAVFIFGFTLTTAALTPHVPDLRLVLNHLLHAAFFLTGILYPITRIPEPYRTILQWVNPMMMLIENYRRILMHDQWPLWTPLAWLLALGLALNLVGLALLRRWEYVYPKLNT